MRYSDQVEVDGRTYQVEGGSAEVAGAGPGAACELTVRAGDAGAGAVEARVAAPAGELAMVGEILQRSLSRLAHLAGAEAGSGPGGQRFRLRVAEDRRRYPKAWTAWSPDDDSRLLDGYRSGMDIGQLAAELGRKPRAIVSRLVKHGVVANAET
ncbi:MAG: hypothetical protein IRZ05_14085 [Micromonosporaceae bacterium]|jgi:hypothetical protein|nr:hypothetical protein [Micromonosporaceae bacterium]